MPSEVLLVGAGPTGLSLALILARSGVRARLIEKNAGPGEASRAMAVQARTLELYRQLGIAEEVVRRGIPIHRIHLRERGHEAALLEFGDFGEGISPYPFLLSFPQDEHERLLIEHLRGVGVEVEWNTELAGFTESPTGVRAVLRREDGEEECEVAYLCGCDGAHSTVRHGIGTGFPGGTYEQLMFVADVEAAGEAAGGDFYGCLEPDGFLLVFPIRTSGMNRLIGVVPEELRDRKDLTFEDVRPFVEHQFPLRVRKVNWFSRYRVHHRVAEHFRSEAGRVFLCGDAGHIHSPAGGQGMNTGIGDAANLAWKLAAVLQGRGAPSLLDTYEPERIAFARNLVATTDRVFTSVVGKNAGGEIVRTLLLPHLAPFLLGFSAVRKAAFRLVSQTRIHYRDSDLSAGQAGEVHGGDRLPWVPDGGSDNFAPLRSLDWQLHVYGAATEPLRTVARELGLPMHELPWSEAAAEAGLRRDALYLVRPDGYVALAEPEQDIAALRSFVARFRIAPRPLARQ
jgi:2-polyprenyl-6-methoxyphenol hydroxylase-like FAD-dependent oxidoreductase